jgi:hypothetical protein
MAFHYDGAWAEYVLTDATMLVAVPESVALEHAAVLADAVSTPYGAIDTAGLRVGESARSGDWAASARTWCSLRASVVLHPSSQWTRCLPPGHALWRWG